MATVKKRRLEEEDAATEVIQLLLLFCSLVHTLPGSSSSLLTLCLQLSRMGDGPVGPQLPPHLREQPAGEADAHPRFCC